MSERIAKLYNKEQEQQLIVSRFKDTNKIYRKVKTIAEEQLNRFWSQALKEPDKKIVLSIVLRSVIEALRQQPERYNIIFGNNNYNNIYEQQDAVLEVSNRVSKALIERFVNQTMVILESQTEAAAAEEETKPEEGEET
jgi:hypothetical protein